MECNPLIPMAYATINGIFVRCRWHSIKKRLYLGQKSNESSRNIVRFNVRLVDANDNLSGIFNVFCFAMVTFSCCSPPPTGRSNSVADFYARFVGQANSLKQPDTIDWNINSDTIMRRNTRAKPQCPVECVLYHHICQPVLYWCALLRFLLFVNTAFARDLFRLGRVANVTARQQGLRFSSESIQSRNFPAAACITIH